MIFLGFLQDFLCFFIGLPRILIRFDFDSILLILSRFGLRRSQEVPGGPRKPEKRQRSQTRAAHALLSTRLAPLASERASEQPSSLASQLQASYGELSWRCLARASYT